MKVDQVLRQETSHLNRMSTTAYPMAPPYPVHETMPTTVSTQLNQMYPHLNDYMGLDLTSEEMSMLQFQQDQFNALVAAQQQVLQPVGTQTGSQMIAPLSGQSVGFHRAQVTNGIREIVLCKDANGKIGLRVKSMNKGVFVVLVLENSPASLCGLRFGDQILQISERDVAGFSMDQIHSMLRQAKSNDIQMIVRDRPFERTVTLHKDNGGIAGFQFKKGKIDAIVVNSSAARNGLLTDHQILEVNGQNVIGMDDKKIRDIIRDSENTLTLTVMPSIIYDKMMEKMSSSLVKRLMDHTVQDF